MNLISIHLLCIADSKVVHEATGEDCGVDELVLILQLVSIPDSFTLSFRGMETDVPICKKP